MSTRTLLIPLLLACCGASAENLVFPPESGATDITKPPYNAVPDGKTDCTTAIQRALTEKKNFIYLPHGTYLISDTLRWGDRQTRQTLQGQSEAGTVIKIIDHTDGFTDPANPKAAVWTGQAPAQRFRNSLRNLTIDTGKGNPGAIGLQYMANNQGTVRHVTIRSGDGAGKIGLDLGYSNEQGPCLIKDVHVTGFDIGVFNKHAVDSVTMEDITVENQNVAGSVNDGQIVTIRNFNSRNRVPAFINKRGASQLTLVGGRILGEGGAAALPAILNQSGLFVRDLEISGYATGIENQAGHRKDHPGLTVDEFTSHPVLSLFPSPPVSLNLPVKETPEVPWHEPGDWAFVDQYAPEKKVFTRKDGKKVEVTDWTSAIQRAIDSGAKTVCFSGAHSFQITGDVIVRGNVERLIGMDRTWSNAGGVPKGRFIFSDGAAPAVLFEHFDATYAALTYVIDTPRTVIIRSVLGNEWSRIHKLEGSGELYLEDVCSGEFFIHGGKVWARQLNMEGEGLKTKILNDGGQLWILGYKTEGDTLLIDSRNGASTEVLGGFIYANKNHDPDKIMFRVEDSSFSAGIGEWVIRKQPFHPLREIRDGETRQLMRGETPPRGEGAMIPLMVAYSRPADAPPRAPGALRARPLGTSEIELSWEDTSDNEGGFIIERSPDGTAFEQIDLARENQERHVISAGLKADTEYHFRVTAFNQQGKASSEVVKATTAPPSPAGTGTGLLRQEVSDGHVGWTGDLEPRYSDSYRFSSDEQSIRLWVDGRRLLDSGSTKPSVEIDLEAGKRHRVKIEQWGTSSDSPLPSIQWRSLNQETEPIPETQLYPADTPQSIVSIALNTSTVMEDHSGDLAFVLTREGRGEEPLRISLARHGTATPVMDVDALPDEVVFPAGVNTLTLPVHLIDDEAGEREEALELTLEADAGYLLRHPTARLVIRDDDIPPPGTGTGLIGTYYNSIGTGEKAGTRLDENLSHNWNKSAPLEGINPKRGNRDTGYTIVWSGYLEPHFDETYRFDLSMSPYGAARLWIDGKQVIDAWDKRSLRSGDIELEAGEKVPIKLEFEHRNFYDGRIRLEWSSPGQFKQTVPQSQLYPEK
ncbi:MAG: PA14 domain-containing protein [Kiritimatiellia bacterium]